MNNTYGFARIGVRFLWLPLAILVSCQSAPEPSQTPAPKEDDVWTLLDKGESDKAKEFFQGKVDVNAKDSQGRAPLHRASEMKDAQLVSFFLAMGAKVDERDTKGRTALEISCSLQDAASAALLSAAKANVFHKGIDGSTPADVALKSGSSLWNAIVTQDSVKMLDPAGKTLLHIAAEKGDLNAVKKVIAAGGSVAHRDESGKNPLDIAYGHAESVDHASMAEALVLKGAISDVPGFAYFSQAVRTANFNSRFADGLAPLHFAAREGHAGYANFLIKKKADVNTKNASGTTPLHETAITGNMGIMKLLLDAGADANAQDAKGNSAMHIVMPKESRVAGIKLLLSKGANPNLKDQRGETPLHLTISLDMGLDILRLLVSGKADVSIRNTEGKTALLLAAELDKASYVQALLDAGADIFAADTKGNTPFEEALAKNGTVLPAMITTKTVTASDNGGNTPLHVAVDKTNLVSIVSNIIGKKANVNARNKAGDTPLHFAVLQNKREIGELLITEQADIFAENGQGQSPLFVGLRGSGGMRSWLLTNTTLTARDGLGNGILHYASQWKLDNIIPVIVQRGASTELRNASGETPLFLAVIGNAPSTIKVLISSGADSLARDNLGNTPLHIAVRWHALDGAKTLLGLGASVDARNLAGKTALHEAVRLGMWEEEKLLLEYGADLEIRDLSGNTVLMEAVDAGLATTVERLVELGSDPNARNSIGDTPLHEALRLGRKDIIVILLSRGSTIHAQNLEGRTPLQNAIAQGPEMMATLLTKDRLLMTNDFGRSALHIAILEKCSPPTLQQLLSMGIKTSSIDYQGKTALRIAIETDAIELIRPLIAAGSDVFAIGADGESPASLVLKKDELFIKELIQGDTLKAKDAVGNTILHYAASHGSAQTVGLLISLGASTETKNVAGEMPLDLAKRWNNSENATILASAVKK